MLVKEYDSLAVGIAICGTAFIKVAVFDKHQEDNDEFATMALTITEVMQYAIACMEGCKYNVDLEGFNNLTRLAALSFSASIKGEKEEVTDGE